MLSGCNEQIPTASCSAPDTQKLIGTLLNEQAGKLTVAKRHDQYEGSTVFGAVKINTLLSAIQVAVTNVKTVKEESNSRQSFCSGLLQVTVPPAMLADVDYAREAQQQPKIAQYAKQLNIANNNNVFFNKWNIKWCIPCSLMAAVKNCISSLNPKLGYICWMKLPPLHY